MLKTAATGELGKILKTVAAVPALRRMRGILREVPLWPAISRRQPGIAVVFLPSRKREMSSLLRIYSIADSLQSLGWQALVIPPTLDLVQRQRLIARFAPDVLVVQGSRHALNRTSLYAGYRIVYDMDDADYELPHLREAVEAAMSDVDMVLAGSREVAKWCRSRGAPARVVWTGAPVSPHPRLRHCRRPPIVAWAQSAPVDYRLERAFVLDVMRRLAEGRPGVRLRLFGRQPGDADDILLPFRKAGIAVEWLPIMRYQRFLRHLDDVAVGLSPICPANPFSRGKSFGKILAYLDRGVPVIASDEADHSLFFTSETGILSNDPAAWAAAIGRLLEEPAARQSMADAGLKALETRLSTQAAARQVDAALRTVLDPVARRQPKVSLPKAA